MPESQPETVSKPRRRVVQNTIFSLLTKSQGAFFSYATTWLLLDVLTIEDYGLYSVLFTGALLHLSMLVQLGIPNLLVRFIPEFFSQSRYGPIHHLFRTANILQMSLALVLLGLLWVFAPRVAGWIDFPGRETVIRVFAVGAFACLLQYNFHALLKGLFRQRTIFKVVLIYNLLRLTAIFYVVREFGTLLSVVIAEGVLFAVSVAMYAAIYHRHILPLVAAEKPGGEPVNWSRYRRYAGLCYLNEIGAALLSTATDLFLVSSLLGGFQAGLYGLASRISLMAQQLLPSRILGEVIEPLFFSEYGESQEKARFGFTLLTKVSLLVALPMAIWLGLMARPVIVNLFDPEFAEAAPILAVQAFFLPMVVMRFALGLMLQNAERIDLLIYSKFTGVVKIAVGIWLVPIYGVMGMVWITVLALTAQNIVNYINILINLRAKTDHAGVLRLVINGAVSALILYLIRDYFQGAIGLFLSLPVYAAIYLALNLVHKTFRQEERDFINTHLRRPLWRF